MADPPVDVTDFGHEYVRAYYDTLLQLASADVPVDACRPFYNRQSKFLYLRHGHPDLLLVGVDAIADFLTRCRYDECALTVLSVDTIEVRAGRLAVLSVVRTTKPGCDDRVFVQSTVVRRGAAGGHSVVIGTVLKFDDRVVDDYDYVYDDDNDSADPTAGGDVPTLPECSSDATAFDQQQLYISKLPKSVKTDELAELFGQFGALSDVQIFKPKTSKSKKFNSATVDFENPTLADEVMTKYRTITLKNGKKITVDKSVKKIHT